MTEPVVVSTWTHGLEANETAWLVLRAGGGALDAAEAAMAPSEEDPGVASVGRGGFPNSEGTVQLDAGIMEGAALRAGAVAALERILHPTAVARRVLERTPYVLLAGAGALRFARAEGFPEEELLTEAARGRWLEWRRSAGGPQDPVAAAGRRPARAGEESHDTLATIALDAAGRVACACTTSGLAWKHPGRVGDSPIVGHGIYADDEVGGACGTGVGEAISRVCGSFLVVERMRAGAEPRAACEAAVERVRRRIARPLGQVAFLALRRDGVWGAAALEEGFRVAVARGGANELHEIPPLRAGGDGGTV